MRILLIRHGESEWNAVGRWQGHADPPLSDLGRRQAATAARALGGFDAIASSTLQRAAETATLVAEHLGIGPVLLDEGLIERDAGAWEGLTRHEIEDGWPGYLRDGRRPEGYEHDLSLVPRVVAALGRLRAEMGAGEALVIAHGGVILALEAAMDEPFARVPNLGGRWVHLDADGFQLGDRVMLVDDEALATTQERDQL